MNMKRKGKQTLTPKLRFPEFREGEGWQEVVVQETATVIAGQSPRGEYYNDTGNGTPFYQGKTDFGDVFINPPTKWTTQVTRLAFKDDILMSVRAPVGALNVSTQEICIGRGLAALRAKEDKWFLYYLLLQVNRLFVGNGGSVFDSINKSQIESTQIPFPLKPAEQQKIADCLNSLDELIAAEGRMLEALKAHKKGLMQQLFPQPGQTQPRLRFPEFRGEGEWKTVNLGDVVSISKGKGVAKSDVVAGGTTPCIRYAELYTIYSEVITHVHSRTDVPVDTLLLSQEGDVIIPASGETKEDIATCACVMNAGVALGSDLNVLRSDIDGRFFSYYLNGVQRRELAKVAQGDTVAHLYPPQVSRLSISIAQEPDEQQAIADCLTSLDIRIGAQAAKIDALRTHKRGLMQQLFPAPEES